MVLPLLALVGCCSTFDRDLDASRTAAGPAPLAGAWEGSWHSDPSGHHGGLRCILSQTDSGFSSRYYATFTWGFIPLSFEYEVPLTVVKDDDAWRFRGSAFIDYFIAGGLYEYEGYVAGEEFVASYRSSFDSGVFRMKRVR